MANNCPQIEFVSGDCGRLVGIKPDPGTERLEFNEALTSWFNRCQLAFEISAVYNYFAQFKLNLFELALGINGAEENVTIRRGRLAARMRSLCAPEE